VDVTPGTAMYQSAGDTSMKTPFATMATPSNTAMPRHTDFNIVDPFMGGRGARMVGQAVAGLTDGFA